MNEPPGVSRRGFRARRPGAIAPQGHRSENERHFPTAARGSQGRAAGALDVDFPPPLPNNQARTLQTKGGHLFTLAGRNLLRAPLRTTLTLLGVSASLAVYSVIGSVSQGYRDQLDRSLTLSGVDVIVQSARAPSPTASRISREEVDAVRALPGVAAVSPVVVGPLRTPNLPYLLVFGSDELGSVQSSAAWLGSGLTAGRLPLPGRGEALIGSLAARKAGLWTGDVVALAGAGSITVSGVFSFGLDVLDGGVVTTVADALKILDREGGYNLALVTVADGTDAAACVRSINGVSGRLSAYPARNLQKRIRGAALIDSFILVVGTASFALACLLVLNTLVMSVNERTRELGILSAIGWSRWMITRMIVAEALLLCLAGGLGGWLLAFAALPLLGGIPALGAGWLPAAPSLRLLPVVLGLSAAAGVASALYPALWSTSLTVVRSLRQE